MKSFNNFFLFAITSLSFLTGFGQIKGDSRDLVKQDKADTNRVKQLLEKAWYYYFSKPDSCLIFTREALELAQKLNFTSGELTALNYAGESLRFMGDYPQALQMQLKALQLNKKTGDKIVEGATLGYIGYIYGEMNEHRQSLEYLFQAKKINDGLSVQRYSYLVLSNIGNAYEKMNMTDSALYFQQEAWTKIPPTSIGNLKSLIQTRLGNIFVRLGKYDQALHHYHYAQQIAFKIKDKVNLSKIQYRISELYLALDNMDSSFFYGRQSFANGQIASQKLQLLETANLLVKLFRKNDKQDSVIYYQDIAIAMNDGLFGPKKYRQLQLLTLEEQKRQQEILLDQERYRNKTRMLALLIFLGSFLIIAIMLYRNVRNKQKVNSLLESQKNEIQKNLVELKSTQAQLIQSEKMASLGELTAGIAHEIQNPLNFVNNFSEVNKELLAEMSDEIEKGNYEEVKALAKGAIDNQEKINHHGKRADAIVKGMLQHSRSSSGVREPTDINVLADEYLRLAYHGLRAKDKSFNATMKTDFDESIGRINIIPQDIGRAILNLITNAFYAVTEKKKRLGDNFEPIVTVSTKAIKLPLGVSMAIGMGVEIKVADNGNGIPQKVLDKIFQPFFTTKPTGQGTGLGLSLSYDIVKAHGGEIKVETKEGAGTEFIIQLNNI